MLGSLILPLPFAIFAKQVGEGFKGDYEGYNSEIGGINSNLLFRVEYNPKDEISSIISLTRIDPKGKEYPDYGSSWVFNHSTFSGYGKATRWSGSGGYWIPHVINPEDPFVSLPQNFRNDIGTYHSPIAPFTYNPPTYVRVSSPQTGVSRIFRLADNGPALWTGHAIDMTRRAQQDINISDGDFVNFEILTIYAGGHNPGVVYKYLGGSDWEPISSELGYAVLCFAEYNGYLYAGVTTGFGGYSGIGRVYRYDGNKTWTLVGDGMDHAVISLAVYKGELYAGTGRGVFRLYKFTPGETNCGIDNWTRVVDYPSWDGVRSLHVSQNYLLMGDTYYDRIARWDGNRFHVDLDDGGSCIYDFQEYGNYVYAAAYMGRLWRSSDKIHWNTVLGYYGGNMWKIKKFKNKLLMSYHNGELRAYSGTGDLRG